MLSWLMSEQGLKSVDVLLIEDNPGDAALIRQVLAESGMNIKVHLATDGQQALQMLKEPDFEPSLIVLDLNIPKISGLSLLQRWFFTTPVVVQFYYQRTRKTTCSGVGSTRFCFEAFGPRSVYGVCLWHGTQVGDVVTYCAGPSSPHL